MPSAVVVIFYIWLIVGTGVFIYRRTTGVPFRTPKQVTADEPISLVADSSRPDTTLYHSTVSEPSTVGPAIQPTVSAILTGISLPCGLVPYLGNIINDRVAFDRVVFSTTAAGVDTVQEALETELSRLGFSLAADHHDGLIATSEKGELGVRIDAPPSSGPHERYPDAAPGAVIVELTTG